MNEEQLAILAEAFNKGMLVSHEGIAAHGMDHEVHISLCLADATVEAMPDGAIRIIGSMYASNDLLDDTKIPGKLEFVIRTHDERSP